MRRTLSPVRVFFDRGVSDAIGYLRLCGLPIPDHIASVAATFRYARRVFIAPGPDKGRANPAFFMSFCEFLLGGRFARSARAAPRPRGPREANHPAERSAWHPRRRGPVGEDACATH